MVDRTTVALLAVSSVLAVATAGAVVSWSARRAIRRLALARLQGRTFRPLRAKKLEPVDYRAEHGRLASLYLNGDRFALEELRARSGEFRYFGEVGPWPDMAARVDALRTIGFLEKAPRQSIIRPLSQSEGQL